jgi:hypothetical protein
MAKAKNSTGHLPRSDLALLLRPALSVVAFASFCLLRSGDSLDGLALRPNRLD